MRIDLHTHSQASDGTQTPGELIRAAADAGLDVVAITDHDTSAGWAEAERVAADVGVVLVRGMEISTKLGKHGVHLLGYLPDPKYPPLVEHLAKILDGRNSRLPRILERLGEAGHQISLEDVHRVAGGTTATGRPHIADALVAKGIVVNRTEAFTQFLNPGRPGYVTRYAAPLDEMIRTVTEAGGVTVIAHPWGRGDPTTLGEEELARLQQVGLSGIEVDHQDHSPEVRDQLRAIARNLDLVVTGSSDHHGLGKIDHELGCNTTAPDQYERLVALAVAAAQRSGREAPLVLAG